MAAPGGSRVPECLFTPTSETSSGAGGSECRRSLGGLGHNTVGSSEAGEYPSCESVSCMTTSDTGEPLSSIFEKQITFPPCAIKALLV